MRWQDFALLDDLGFSSYEKKALIALSILGIADAISICREGDIPTSKIYRAMEKLDQLGLADTQPTRPKLYAARSAEQISRRLMEIAWERAEQVAAGAETLKRALIDLPARMTGRQAFVDLALGTESHVRRHLIHLSTAKRQILSYVEEGDLNAINKAVAAGFPILRRISRNAAERKLDHRMVFGFSHRSAPGLVEFLRKHGSELEHVTGVRYSGELSHPFHVADEELVILPLDHPFIPEGRFASLLVRDRELAHRLAAGFDVLWHKAMRDLQEIDFHPGSDSLA